MKILQKLTKETKKTGPGLRYLRYLLLNSVCSLVFAFSAFFAVSLFARSFTDLEVWGPGPRGEAVGIYRNETGALVFQTRWTGLYFGIPYALQVSTNAVEWRTVALATNTCMTNAPIVLECPYLPGPGPRLVRLKQL